MTEPHDDLFDTGSAYFKATERAARNAIRDFGGHVTTPKGTPLIAVVILMSTTLDFIVDIAGREYAESVLKDFLEYLDDLPPQEPRQ